MKHANPIFVPRKTPYRHKWIGFRCINPGDVDAYARRAGTVPVDLRSRAEFDAGHIPGAVHHPYAEIETFEAESGKDYLLYCGSGRLSEYAYFKILERFPKANLAVVRLGFHAWQVETSDPATVQRMATRPREAVVLMTPSADQKKLWGKFSKLAGFYMPVPLMTIADNIDKLGFETHILDASAFDLSEDEVAAYLTKVRPRVVGITTYTSTAYDVFRTARLIKRLSPETLIVAGGIHCAIFPDKTIDECPELDAVCTGEGERTFIEFCERVIRDRADWSNIQGLFTRRNGEVVKNAARPQIPVEELGTYLNPAYHLVPMERYVPPAANYKELPTYSTFVSRGCPFKCNFCNAGDVFGTSGRYRPVGVIIDELRYLQKHYAMRGMYFMDGTFATNQRWVHEFCDAVERAGIKLSWFTWTRTDLITQELAHKLKRSGCWKVGVGVESGNQQSLDLLRKGLQLDVIKRGIRYFQEAKIQVNCSYMLGIPGETPAHVENTLRFAKELKTESAIFFLPVPMPGGGFFELAKKYGGLRTTDIERWTDYSTFNFANPLYINPLIGKERSIHYYNTAFSRFFLDPAVIWRNVRWVRSPQDALRLLAGFHSIIYFFNPRILAKRVTEGFIAYQGSDRTDDANIERNEIYDKELAVARGRGARD